MSPVRDYASHRFELVMQGPPVSLNVREHNKRRYRKWIATVHASAETQWPKGQPCTGQEVEVVLNNYYTAVPPDVDNIVKPILDALKGLVYHDDNQVRKVTSERFAIISGMRISSPSTAFADALEKWNEIIQVVISWEEEEH